MTLTKERIEALCTDGLYAAVSGDQQEWDELRELALNGLERSPEATAQKAARYDWLNQQHNFVLYVEDEQRNREHLRLRCGLPLDEWIDNRIAEESKPQPQPAPSKENQ